MSPESQLLIVKVISALGIEFQQTTHSRNLSCGFDRHSMKNDNLQLS